MKNLSSAIASAAWSPSNPAHKLVTSEIYGLIRHPSYLGLLVNALGWALAFR
jgi:protein-S-isoprenylcysteine O-methyltransferase Ste14